MKQLTLRNGLTVSCVALGAMNFGTTTDRAEAFRTLDLFVEAGGNLIDTSNNYAHWQGTGDESETLLGEWLSERGCRDRVLLATKVGFDRKGQGAGLRREQIEYWIDESLRKLRTDYVDLYYAHTDDPNTPLEETMEAFDRLVRKGKVRVLGASNYDTWRLAEANMLAEHCGWTPYTVMQQRLTYLNARSGVAPKYPFNEISNRERLRYLASKQIPLVSYSCLIRGAYEGGKPVPDEYEKGDRYDFIRAEAAARGVSPSALVIAWLTALDRCEGYPTVIPLFAGNAAQLAQNLTGLEIGLTYEDLARFNAVL